VCVYRYGIGPDLGLDLDRFPRENLHIPEPKDNPLGAWAYRCTVKDTKPDPNGVLHGKTIALKDCIALAGVPMQMGSSILNSFTPVRLNSTSLVQDHYELRS
jgi:amidase